MPAPKAPITGHYEKWVKAWKPFLGGDFRPGASTMPWKRHGKKCAGNTGPADKSDSLFPKRAVVNMVNPLTKSRILDNWPEKRKYWIVRYSVERKG